mmetsp:Transcript_14043/g.20546  ORF Transcript_14043/g.20546 Transcript_14043/m.20546 type:complete len:103 (+) Transcript_14043:559-867(+)
MEAVLVRMGFWTRSVPKSLLGTCKYSTQAVYRDYWLFTSYNDIKQKAKDTLENAKEKVREIRQKASKNEKEFQKRRDKVVDETKEGEEGAHHRNPSHKKHDH